MTTTKPKTKTQKAKKIGKAAAKIAAPIATAAVLNKMTTGKFDLKDAILAAAAAAIERARAPKVAQ